MLSRKYLFILCFANASRGLRREQCSWRMLMPWEAVLSSTPVSPAHILCHSCWALAPHERDNVTLLALRWQPRQMPPSLFTNKTKFLLHLYFLRHGKKQILEVVHIFMWLSHKNSCFVDNYPFMPLLWLKILRTGTSTTWCYTFQNWEAWEWERSSVLLSYLFPWVVGGRGIFLPLNRSADLHQADFLNSCLQVLD